MISVDTKKKEVVGNLANKGREWQPQGSPVRADVHDFPDPQVGQAIPYGVYDLGADAGWVSVGDDHDTASFAVATIRRWWEQVGKQAAETGLAVTVCHFPPGTSKWNRIEHRLFFQISMNWRGRPLVSHEVIVDLIGATTTRTGLEIHAELDRGSYPTGVKVSDAELGAVPLTRHDWHGEWNYTIAGATTRTTAAQFLRKTPWWPAARLARPPCGAAASSWAAPPSGLETLTRRAMRHCQSAILGRGPIARWCTRERSRGRPRSSHMDTFG